MKWDMDGDGTFRLLLYRGGEQSFLLFTKQEIQNYILTGWEQRLQTKMADTLKKNPIKISLQAPTNHYNSPEIV